MVLYIITVGLAVEEEPTALCVAPVCCQGKVDVEVSHRNRNRSPEDH